MLNDLKNDVQEAADPEKAKFLARFFKTGKGEYGEGDIFLGLTVPQSRKLAIQYRELPLAAVTKLLASKFHEERLIALLILVHNFSLGIEEVRKTIYDFYLAHTKYINNWDLVDLSADKIVGEYVYKNPSQPPLIRGGEPFSPPDKGELEGVKGGVLYKLAHSQNLWERRIAMIATFAFIKRGSYEETFVIAEILLNDKHDLIQKAVGWMLREVGKRISEEKLEDFLGPRYRTMPRTSLRYAIERFPEEKRVSYLRG